MKPLTTYLLFFLLFLNFYGGQVTAQSQDATQEEKPAVAILHNKGEGNFTIETTVSAKITPKRAVSAVLYEAGDKVTKRIARSNDVPDCSEPLEAGKICKNVSNETGKVTLVYLFPKAPDSPKSANKYSMAFSIPDVQKGDIEQLVKIATIVDKITPVIETFDEEETFYTKVGFGRVKNKPNGIIRIPIRFSSIGSGDTRSKEYDEYIDERITAIYDWLEPQRLNPSAVANVRVEPRTKEISKPEDLNFSVLGFSIKPNGRRDAQDANAVDIILITDRKFPSDKFDFDVEFKNNPPSELTGKLLGANDGIANIATTGASGVGKDTTLGLREFKSSIDFGFAFTSSVEQKEENGRQFRKRENNAVFDLMFAPVFNYSLDVDETHFITPFFIDAKANTGKIAEKTLSLNRILIGTQYSYRLRSKDTSSGNLNKYIFTFRGINASDRDFKRVEGKFNFEFRPLFDKWNNPLKYRIKEPLPDSIINPEGGKKIIPVGWFGYQIQPVVGFEIGRVYRIKRGAFANEEGNRNIRRFFVGMDILLNITRRANLKISDTYYVRGEAPDARYRNYFNGELEAPFFTSGDTAQSIFFSFERGEQPPFATPSVNSLKVGYRITSNWFRLLP